MFSVKCRSLQLDTDDLLYRFSVFASRSMDAAVLGGCPLSFRCRWTAERSCPLTRGERVCTGFFGNRKVEELREQG